MGDYDRSSKWLIQHHGDSLLRLAGVGPVAAWRPLQAEVVQPGQLPDGLLEVQIAAGGVPDLFVLELATYPEGRVVEQLLRDTLLVLLDRKRVPEVIVIVLHPKGQMAVPAVYQQDSRLALAGVTVRWRVVEVWNLSAEELLQTGDPGVVPWVPLARFEGPPAPLLERCRDIIERAAPEDERVNLLAVTQVLARLRYNDLGLLSILGGRRVMIESPLIQELVSEAEARGEARGEVRGEARGEARGQHRALMTVLRTRFRAVPAEVEAALAALEDEAVLTSLIEHATQCRSMAAFRSRIPS